jgi:hypothetical protein
MKPESSDPSYGATIGESERGRSGGGEGKRARWARLVCRDKLVQPHQRSMWVSAPGETQELEHLTFDERLTGRSTASNTSDFLDA